MGGELSWGLEQGSFNWHNKLKKALMNGDFVEFVSDPYVYISRDMTILVHVDDFIFALNSTFTKIIHSLSNLETKAYLPINPPDH